ncbi:MAG: LytR/AlgR family response regulator transcription factor [Bryobacteraceae bacterium]
MRVFLVDDEALALKRLAHLLGETGRVEIVGTATDPIEAVDRLASTRVDALFLDIEMPEMNGFELLSRLPEQPLVVFVTAYDRYALRAFEVNSIDYLLKPVDGQQLARALNKLDRLRRGIDPRPDVLSLAEQLAEALRTKPRRYPDRVASRIGEKVVFIELSRVSHFYAEDKLTFAATPEKSYPVDHTISDLEKGLDSRRFVRVHRSALVNLDYVRELHAWLGGRMLIRLRDSKNAEIPVARDRVRVLKERLGL